MSKSKNRLFSQVSAIAMLMALSVPEKALAHGPESLCDLAAKSVAKKLEGFEKEEKNNGDAFASLIAGNPPQETLQLVLQHLKPGATFFKLFKSNEEKLSNLTPEEKTQKRVRTSIKDGFLEVLSADYFDLTRNADKSLSIQHRFFGKNNLPFADFQLFQSLIGKNYFKLSITKPLEWDHDAISLFNGVHCKGLKIEGLGGDAQKLSEFLEATDGQLRELNLGYSNNKLDKTAAEVIAKSGKLANLTSLNLWNNNIGVEGAKAIATGNFTNLTLLNLGKNNIGADGAKALGTGKLANLTSLDLWNNNIGDEGAKVLGTGNLKKLTVLNLDANRIHDEGAKAIATGNFTNLTSLVLTYNDIGDEGAKVLAEEGNFTNLTALDLAYNDIGAEGAKVLANSEKLSTLTSLVLGLNHIGAEGAKALANSEKLSTLTSLDIAYNNIGVEGAKALATGNFTRLTSLVLMGNKIRAEGAKALAAGKLANLTS